MAESVGPVAAPTEKGGPEKPVMVAPEQIPAAREQIVTPFDVAGGTDETGKALGIDYDKLITQFGCRRIDAALLQRFEAVTGHRPHRLMRRGIVFSHRDLDFILNKYEAGQPFFLYTGRGPSSGSMHVGHTIPFEFTKWLQEVFDVPLVVMLTDDEKFFHSPKLTLDECHRFALQNAADIVALGFDVRKTFLFIDTAFLDGGLAAGAYAAGFNRNVRALGKRTTSNQIKGTFGFGDSNNIAEFHFPALQSAAAFADSFPFLFGADRKRAQRTPCLIPCAIDQDPYFRQCREHARALGSLKPALVHAVFLPSLRGRETKMSASDPDSSVFLSDSDKQIARKIGAAFSGGQDSRERHRELGGRTEVDVPFQYLRFFLEDDDELKRIRTAYEAGEMESGAMKKRCADEVKAYVAAFRERRAQVTDAVRDEFLRPRPLAFRGSPFADTGEREREVAALATAIEAMRPVEGLRETVETLEKKMVELKAS